METGDLIFFENLETEKPKKQKKTTPNSPHFEMKIKNRHLARIHHPTNLKKKKKHTGYHWYKGFLRENSPKSRHILRGQKKG
jgi:hypothetical protein